MFVVYLVGCVFFFARFLYSTIRICRMIGMGEKQVLPDGSKLVVTDETVCPFSWMGYIVISQKDMEESGEEILTHEMAHIRAGSQNDWEVCTCISVCICAICKRYSRFCKGRCMATGSSVIILKNVIAKYFNNSYLGVVSSLIKEEDISVDELRKLLDEVEQGNKN